MYVLNILNVVYTLRFFSSSKCSSFRDSNAFGSYIIHILHTGCAKIKKNNFCAKRLKRPYRLWGPLNLLFNGYRCLFFRNKSGRCVKLTTNF